MTVKHIRIDLGIVGDCELNMGHWSGVASKSNDTGATLGDE